MQQKLVRFLKKNSIRYHLIYMTPIDDIVFFCLFIFKAVNAINDKVDNCTYICKHCDFYSQQISSYLSANSKAAKHQKKIIAMQMLLRLHSEHEVFFRD